MNAIQEADSLIESLRKEGDASALFYAMLLKARVELGVSPFPTGPSTDLPEAVHEPYEQAIRTAAREVGQMLLAKNDLPRAWGYYRLINEPQAIKDALENYQPGPDDDIYPILDIAWYQKLHAHRGFDLLLERNGVCSAITTLGSTDLSSDPALRAECIRKLTRALHEQLKERLANDLASRGLPVPGTIPEMIRDEIMEDDAVHIDVSHLSSVVQMSLELPPGDAAIPLALDLCAYGQRLSPGYRGGGDPPFEDTYTDYEALLRILQGERNLLQHFEAKAATGIENGTSFPAEVLVNLLLRLDDTSAALAAAKQYLAASDDRGLSCPTIVELARKANDYTTVLETATANGDAVTALAARILLNAD